MDRFVRLWYWTFGAVKGWTIGSSIMREVEANSLMHNKRFANSFPERRHAWTQVLDEGEGVA